MTIQKGPVLTNLLDLVGNTPLLQLKNIDTGKCDLFVKLENQNPGGSIKDRIAKVIIEQAEAKGLIKPGGTIIEATAGNTGLGLALIASLKGYKIKLVIPDKMSSEKIFHLRAMGAEIILTRSDVGKGHPEYYQDLAERIAQETPNSYYVNQFANEFNPLAHELTTAPEIWEQMDHDVDAFVCGVGSGGTLSGIGRYFKNVSPKTKMILADPKGSILTDYVNEGKMGVAGSWFVEGVGEDFIPSIADMDLTKKAYSITDQESFDTARELLLKEGILAGSSTGTLLAAAIKYCKESPTKQRVVTLICDSGNKYLSKMFNDYWMKDNGFIKTEKYGDLRDYVARPAVQGRIVSVRQDDTLMVTYNRMRMHDYSQLPVIENEKVVGMIDEFDLLISVERDPKNYFSKVGPVMATNLVTLDSSEPIGKVMDLLRQGKVGLITHKGHFYGMITKTDILTQMRNHVRNV